MMLEAVHPGVTIEHVLANTGWPLLLAAEVTTTPAPTAGELAIIRRFDPEGFWTKDEE
jgi:glutaconate CoA-transferase subunit B